MVHPLRTTMLIKRFNWFGGRVNENYGWELALCHRLREFSDGITAVELNLNWDRYLADHSPRFSVHLVILNYTIVEASVYYLHHREE
jgi:hypothetical protein